MGARLLKRWMVMPLNDIVKINERLDTVEYLIKEVDTRTKIAQHIKQAGDVERLVSKVPLKKDKSKGSIADSQRLAADGCIKNICAECDNEYFKRLGDSLKPLQLYSRKNTEGDQ